MQGTNVALSSLTKVVIDSDFTEIVNRSLSEGQELFDAVNSMDALPCPASRRINAYGA
jgi:hypothetical protein